MDKVAVVTGGASGIGRAMCERFAAEGAKVAVADLDQAAGAALAEAIDGMFVEVDVTSAAAVESLYDAVAERFGGIDILCNNAGISPPDDDSILDTGIDAWQPCPRGQPDVGLPVLQVRDPAPARPGRWFGHQHGVLRGGDGGGHQPDQLHGQQGGRPGHVRESSASSSPGRGYG